MRQYRFPRHPVGCAACGRDFVATEEVVSQITAGVSEPGEAVDAPPPDASVEDEEMIPFVRRDYCPDCAPQTSELIFSSWRTRVPTPRDADKPVRVDTRVVHELFQRLAEREDEDEAGYVYFLALYLMRKRVLKFLDSQREEDEDGIGEQEVWVLESRPEGKRYLVRDPRMDADALEKIRIHVMDALSAGDMEL